jgi:hypothetical protein
MCENRNLQKYNSSCFVRIWNPICCLLRGTQTEDFRAKCCGSRRLISFGIVCCGLRWGSCGWSPELPPPCESINIVHPTIQLHGADSSLTSHQLLSCSTISQDNANRNYITVLTRGRNWTLAWATSILFPYDSTISFQPRLRPPRGLLPSGLPCRVLYTFLFAPLAAPSHTLLVCLTAPQHIRCWRRVCALSTSPIIWEFHLLTLNAISQVALLHYMKRFIVAALRTSYLTQERFMLPN